MKKYPLSNDQIKKLLEEEPVGRLATIGEDGYPYVVPVHYVLAGDCIYMHGLAAGEKISNIKRNTQAGFEIDRMNGLSQADTPCDTNTVYESVVIRGKARLVEDEATRVKILGSIVAKYTPQHSGKAFPDTVMRKTAVIELTIESCTGKYYPA
ncbi:pyridoxamine 5'-phosphate oxidase family protein [Desulfovibrio sp. OttesenSCG-928-C06]|nr:pyridoxamine 5'-phosphate oxidase family protein [Desulfovibrio sp. OttesenSCG-928-C06]